MPLLGLAPPFLPPHISSSLTRLFPPSILHSRCEIFLVFSFTACLRDEMYQSLYFLHQDHQKALLGPEKLVVQFQGLKALKILLNTDTSLILTRS